MVEFEYVEERTFRAVVTREQLSEFQAGTYDMADVQFNLSVEIVNRSFSIELSYYDGAIERCERHVLKMAQADTSGFQYWVYAYCETDAAEVAFKLSYCQ